MHDGARQTLEWTKYVDIALRDDFDAQARSVYTYGDDEQIGGYFRHDNKFIVMITPKAGHMAPASQPELTMKYIYDLVNHSAMRCADGNICETMAADMCSYMNNCNG